MSRKGLLFLFASAFALRLTLIAILSPSTDVFYVNREAISVLLSGGNPYVHEFTTIPKELITQSSENVYAYLPFTLLFYVPFYPIDIRVGSAVADLLVALSIYMIRKELFGDRGLIGPAIYLFFPPFILFTSYYSNNVAISASFALLSIYVLLKGRGALAGFLFGLSLSSLQLSFALLPILFYYCMKKGMSKFVYVSLLTLVAITLPFLLNPGEFFRDILLFQLQRLPLSPVSENALNLSLSGLLLTLGISLPLSIRSILTLALLPPLMALSTRPKMLLISLAIYSALFAFLFPSETFAHYYLPSISLFIAGLGLEKLKYHLRL